MRHMNAKLNCELESNIAKMQSIHLQRDQQIQELSSTLSSQNTQLSNAIKEIGSLRCTIAELNSKLEAQTWQGFRSKPKDKPTLVVGSSIMRDISEARLKDTELVCIPGGLISDVTAELSKRQSDKYGRIVLVAGGNDCNPRDSANRREPRAIVDQYKSLVNLCKTKSQSVTVSSICPRISNTDVKS